MRRKLLLAVGLFIGVVGTIYGFLALRSQPMPNHPFFVDDDLLVIAHQGGDGLRPSNTMAAFEHAVELGVDVLEMDIHSTKDGVLVTIHDATVDRTTNGSGPVHDFTFAELQALDAAYHWPTLPEIESGTTPYRGQGIMIPALEEIFEAFPQMRMVIEIKQQEPSIVSPFCSLLREHDLSEQVLVASFHTAVMVDFRATCPEVATSATEDEIRPFFILHTLRLGAVYQPAAHAFQVPEFAGDLHVLTANFVRAAQAHNIDVHAWTINNSEQMQRMIELGVDGIISDFPDRLLAMLGR